VFLLKKLFILIALFLITLLPSCSSSSKSNRNNYSSNEAISFNKIELWNSKGSAYKQTALNTPDGIISISGNKKDVYSIISVFDGNKISLEIYRNSNIIYAPGDTSISCIDAVSEGVWILESLSDDTHNLKLISTSGEVIETISLSSFADMARKARSLLYNSGRFFINCGDEIAILSDSGQKIANHKMPSADKTSLIAGGDGNVYVVCYYDDTTIIYTILDETGIEKILEFTTNNLGVFGGNEKFCFFMSNDEGLFGLEVDGSLTPILIWEDCGIAVIGIKKIIPLPDDEYACLDAGGISKFIKVDPSEIGKRKVLVLATIDNINIIKSTVSNFNRDNCEYTVIIKDYSEDGIYDKNKAIARLNTDIISGNCPDLILFSALSPYTYISKGYLLDLYQFIDNDNQIAREDIAILKQLDVNGSVFFLSSTFNIETLVALYSDFGDAYGWTLNKYLEIEKIMPPDTETLHNNTRRRFLRQISSRYINTAIDWKTGKCDFNNDKFISILEASARVKENPENPAEMDYTYSSVKVAKGTRIASVTWVDNVGKLAFEEKMAGCRLSYIGWPTVDGSCGSDIYISAPVGICSQTDFADGCWEFLKYMLTDVDINSFGRIPVYMPFLQKQIEQAKIEAPIGGTQISNEDAERFFKLLGEINNVAVYDEIISNIIEEEVSLFFAGEKNAEETAAIIQSRIQLYVSEQFS
jgi:hypothetical protein